MGTEARPLVSVVIPTHNRCGLLERAVNSALKQTWAELEVLVVSDDSQDGTDAMMKQKMVGDQRIRYFAHHPARGGNAARNRGILESKGDYVAFLDDDDEWHADKIEKQMNQIRNNPEIGLICTGINSVYEGEKAVSVFIPPALEDSSREIFLHNCIGSTTTVLVKRSLFDSCGMFDEDLNALQDYDMWIRLCQKTKVGVVREACVEYYNYANSNQISSFVNKYAQAVDYIADKYKEEIANLSSEERRMRECCFSLLLAKKAIRNHEPKVAREYVRRAAGFSVNRSVILCFLASFFSPEFVRKIKSIM